MLLLIHILNFYMCLFSKIAFEVMSWMNNSIPWFELGVITHPSPNHSWVSYRQVSNIRRTLVGNQIVDPSDVVGASPVGAAPTTSSFST